MTVITKPIVLTACTVTIFAGCGLALPSGSSDDTDRDRLMSRASASLSEQQLAERAQLSASGRYLMAPDQLTAATADLATLWGDALDLPPAIVTEAVVLGPAEGAAVRNSLGIIRPFRGDSFVLLSTGVAGSSAPEPGTDFAPTGTGGDVIALRLNLQVPAGANKLSLLYNFLSAESPDFIGTVFNDAFSVQLVDASGTRTSTLASVNSSTFFEASASRARGTGFDILAADPADVDVVFEATGQPDAGLTGFQLFSADVIGGENLEVLLTIQDNGDGILDSAVLLDSLTFSAIETIDPNPALVVDRGSLSGNNEDLVTLGQRVLGTVADGATKILLRVNVPGPGNVTFSLPGGGERVAGSLSPVRGDQHEAGLTVPTVETTKGHFALAEYVAPADFVREDADRELVERSIEIAAVYTPADVSGGFETQVDLKIKRPPVVLAHALWSNPLEWQRLALTSDPRFAITYVDYTYSCKPEVPVLPPGVKTCPVPQDGSAPLCRSDPGTSINVAVKSAIENVRRLGIAATRVDVVAHGAAGLRIRRHIDGQGYRSNANLNQGDINRLVTVNTPHFGSAVAEAIVAARDKLPGAPKDDFMCNARVLSKAAVEDGDIDELTRAQISLKRTPVPGHAIVGLGGTTLARSTSVAKLLDMSRIYIQVEVRLLPFRIFPLPPPFPALPSNAFGVCDHDLFTDVVSQRGGIEGTAVSEIALTPEIPDKNHVDGYSDSSYFHSMKLPAVSEQLVELLNGEVGGPLFAQFPESTTQRCDKATGTVIAGPAPAPAATTSPALAATGTVRIVSPADGTVVSSGDLVTVEVVGEDGFVPQTVLALGGGSAERSSDAPFTLQFKVPSEALGPLRLFAIGIDADGETVLSDDVVLNVRTSAAIEAVRIITQDPFLFGAGARQQLFSLGRFNDGVSRDITTRATGTVYRTSNPSIVTVSDEGVITAVGAGIATVAVQNGGRQDSVSVTVRKNVAPLASAGDDVTLSCVIPGQSTPVTLDGSASTDLDGDPITLVWSEGGVVTALGETLTVEIGAGIHTFDLAVFDGMTSVANDAVQVSILEDTEPPALTVLGDTPATLECGAPHQDDGAVATDTCSGDLTGAIVSTSDVQTNVPGDYKVTYEVKDRAGLTAAAARPMTVVDRLAPALTILGSNPVTADCGLAYRDDGAAALDLCDGDLSGSVVVASDVDTRAPGTYSVDYLVRDDVGLTTSAARSVVVVDRTGPEVSIAPMIELEPKLHRFRLFTLSDCASAIDGCTGSIDIDPAGRIEAIHSDEPNSSRHRDPDSDIVILSDRLFLLRQQSDKHGNGRVYEVEFAVRDGGGNVSGPHSCFVGVKTKKHAGTPVNDGRVHTVRR
jgi:hypothetical protein